MAPLRIDPPKPEWLTLERACFGFDASLDGRRFSFKDAYALVNLHAMKHVHEAMRYKLVIHQEICTIILYEHSSGQSRITRVLDDILEVGEYASEKYKSFIGVLTGCGLPDSLAVTFTLTRDFLIKALKQSLDEKFARAFARVGSPLAGEFTEIPADSLRAFTIEQFHSGYATAVDGSRLFSLHIAPEGTIANEKPSSMEFPPKQASFVRYIIAEHGGRWPDSQWKPLLLDFEAWTDVQTGDRTSIGRSLAADLKRRFPLGFSIDVRPLNNFGP
jgi:hypothetical protein